jgi:acetate kinase
MREPILILNAGSSSVKFSVFDTGADRSLTAMFHGAVDSIMQSPRMTATDAGGSALLDRPLTIPGHDHAIAGIHAWLATRIDGEAALAGVGHRIVHGGPRYVQPVTIDERVLADLDALVPLAPLHQPHNLAAVRAVRAVAPDVPQIACFDTAFHAALPPAARTYALPRDLTSKGIRRYGFHGLSYEYIVSALPRVAPDCVGKRLVVAHLGNGASLCAVNNGRSVATTMGFTPLDGLMMGTRAGALDPGIVLYLLQHDGMNVAAVADLLYEQSGLLGVSGVSSDMRTLLASDAPAAREAIDLFVYRAGQELAAMAAALQGFDALIFTGGIGEHAAEIRARVCRDARWLGVTLDDRANARHGPHISRPDSPISAWVIPTDENLMIAHHTRRLLDRR